MPTAVELKAFYDRPEWFEGGEKGGYANYDSQTAWGIDLVASILDRFADGRGRSILDLGCGYGTHLAAAAKRGWSCFGVELSDHARKIAQERLGESAYVVQSTADLFPHKFDLVLMLDVIEHLPSPYPALYELFALGAIAPDTIVAIATPNAGADAARRDPAGWQYRHPPSHLVYYTAESLIYLLRHLRFQEIDVRGVSPAAQGDLAASGGLMAIAKGSDFQSFMQERYVPGTWSKIAAYEHVPRYALAQPLAAGKTVLDFGCGTGYGAAMMAETAAHVTGLDIDASALAFARATHRADNLAFRCHDDLGASLPEASFDLVTCFEMIEHVDFATQQRVVASIARLLRPDGLFLISTPNPETTKLYGANPYHIREMTEAEFADLLRPSFSHVRILRQRVRSGVVFAHDDAVSTVAVSSLGAQTGAEPAMAFIALCARGPIPDLQDRVFLDEAGNYVGEFIAQEQSVQTARAAAYTQTTRAVAVEAQYRVVSGERDEALARVNKAIHARNEMENARNEMEQAKIRAEQQVAARTEELAMFRRVREDELSSPRFLARHLWQATRIRLRAIIQAKLSGKP